MLSFNLLQLTFLKGTFTEFVSLRVFPPSGFYTLKALGGEGILQIEWLKSRNKTSLDVYQDVVIGRIISYSKLRYIKIFLKLNILRLS